MIIDLKTMNTKIKLLDYFVNLLDDMHSSNYDAFIDSLTGLKEGIFNFININNYEDKENLLEILNIIQKDNPNITILIN